LVPVGVHVIARPRLARPPMTSSIMGDTAIAVAGQEEHLVFKGIRVETIRVIEDNGLSRPPILKIELGAVLRGDGAHIDTGDEAGALPNSQSPVVAEGGGDRTTMTHRGI
jgi:hypothetical protein